jgi:hypothetical protein
MQFRRKGGEKAQQSRPKADEESRVTFYVTKGTLECSRSLRIRLLEG